LLTSKDESLMPEVVVGSLAKMGLINTYYTRNWGRCDQ
jgi:hypothetical protein